MYEDLTPEFIKSDILEKVNKSDTREGSYANTLISPAAYEMWKVYQSLDSVIPMVFVDETSGKFIDKNAAVYGIARKPGKQAEATMAFHGTNGTTIVKGKVFLTEDSRQYTLDDDVTIAGGSGAGSVTALEVGERYNAPAGAIFRQLVNQSGVESVVSEAAVGGADRETDGALVARYNEYRRRPATSGNMAHYKQWALEVDGVGAAKVFPLKDGPGTVTVLIVGSNNQPVDSVIVSDCASYIEDVRPIGATVTVSSAKAKEINVSAQVILSTTTNETAVKLAFEKLLSEYLIGIAFVDYLVVYNRIGYILLDIPGVVDYIALTVNGGTSDIAIADDEVPTPGAIEVTE